MNKKPSFTGLILAAGSGERLGKDIPKQYRLLQGKPILRHTIERFLSHPALNKIYVVINAQHIDYYNKSIDGLNLPLPVIGGNSRKDSCYNGLIHIANDMNQNDLILIHDAARPFITITDINNVLFGLQEHASVSLGYPICETLRRADQNDLLSETIDRSNVWGLQTPQGFHFGSLLKAHKDYKDIENFTDDCGVMEAAGHKTKIIKGSRNNMKITWAEDLKAAEKIMSQNTRTIIGQGFDVHAFGEEISGNIKLGGIDVPHNRKLIAHSDGDVVLHALTDALLGAIGEGDIGLHFPPSDLKWKDKDSVYFLLEAKHMADEKGAEINNVDITIICEEPKLTPHREAIRKRIADILNLKETFVNVKATTTEKLGFTGRREGIACQASICANIINYADET